MHSHLPLVARRLNTSLSYRIQQLYVGTAPVQSHWLANGLRVENLTSISTPHCTTDKRPGSENKSGRDSSEHKQSTAQNAQLISLATWTIKQKTAWTAGRARIVSCLQGSSLGRGRQGPYQPCLRITCQVYRTLAGEHQQSSIQIPWIARSARVKAGT